MDVRLGVAVMAHPKRAAYVDELLASLDAEATVVWDTKQDRWDTGCRAVLAYREHPEVTHWLVLQDDAIVCRDFVASATRAVSARPDSPVCFYFGHGLNQAHQRTNRIARSVKPPSWVVFEGPWWGVAVCIPVEIIESMIVLADMPRESRAYDKRLSSALIKLGIDCSYTLPSLVDHRLDGPSMIAGRQQEDRHAHHFIGADTSGLGIDWNAVPVVDAHKPGRRPTLKQRSGIPKLTRPSRPRPKPAGMSAPRISVAVMGHPKREPYISELVAALDAPAKIVMDERNDRWDTGRRSLLAYDPEATHHLVVQDDAIVCADLVAGLSKAVEVVPDNPIGLYVGNIRPANQLMGAMVHHAQQSGASWVVGDGPWWGVAVCIPVPQIEPLVAWCDRRNVAAYDRRMSQYFAAQRIDCYYTMPSLVDHREGPSLVAGRNAPGRKARSFTEGSALDIDWTRLPHLTGEPFVTYQGPGSRRMYRCLSCDYYTPVLPSMHLHLATCIGRKPTRIVRFRHVKTKQVVHLRADSYNAARYRQRAGWVEVEEVAAR